MPGCRRSSGAVHRLLAPRAAGFVVASSQGVERLRALGVPSRAGRGGAPERGRGGDRGGRAGGGARQRAGARDPAVGRLVPDKNLDGLIAAFAEAGLAEGEAELETARHRSARGGAARSGGAARRARGASRGRFRSGELGGVYAAADVLALVSTYEPFGVTLREGAAAGLPLIASRRAGATGDVAVEGENALVVDPDDRDQIATRAPPARARARAARAAGGGQPRGHRAPPAGGGRRGVGASDRCAPWAALPGS